MSERPTVTFWIVIALTGVAVLGLAAVAFFFMFGSSEVAPFSGSFGR